MTTSFEIALHDLRAALVSVLPHVDAGKDAWHPCDMVRLLPGPVNLEVMATDRATAALAVVSVLEHHSDGGDAIDISHTDARALLAVFKPPPNNDDTVPEQFTLRVSTGADQVTFTDSSGMLEGASLTVPRADTEFPSVARAIGSHLGTGRRGKSGLGEEAWVHVKSWQKWVAAAKAYQELLVVEHFEKVALVRVGESFIGMMARVQPDEEAVAQARRWRQGWVERLPASSQVVPLWSFTNDTTTAPAAGEGDEQ